MYQPGYIFARFRTTVNTFDQKETAMDFELTNEQTMLQDTIRKFAENEIGPVVEEAENKGTISKDLVKKIADIGILKVGQPEQYGGYGGRLEECLVTEELARINVGIATIIVLQKIVLPILFRLGTKAQIEEYAIPILEGKKLAALSVTEPGAGSDVKSIRTRVEKNGDHYVMNGTKMFTSMADICDFMVVAAYTNKSIGFKGIGVFLLDNNNNNITINRIKKFVTVPASTNEVCIEDCKIHKSKLLGEEEGGFQNIMETFNGERILSAARSVGLARAAYEAALKYANERIQFKRRISEFQVIAYKLSDMILGIEAARNLVYKAAWLYDNKKRYVKEASMAKLFATEMAQKVTLEAIQIHGGYGVTEDFPVARYHRDSLIGTIGAGTSEIQRYIIAKESGIKLIF
ncbi:acyl-CoA dehydrogenase [Candidatus Parcubacteria bacterium]|nr:MAG: acyl-CoA dehydrogenase [Candidatus Parcubacteria bacterium]